MRNRKLIALLLAALVMPAFGEGQKDVKPVQITMLAGPDLRYADYAYKEPSGAPTLFTKIFQEFQAETGAMVVYKLVDLSTGSTLSMDALTASGQAPDVYNDYAGRVSKYVTPEFALALDPYIKDVEDFDETMIAQLRRDGKLLALPTSVWINGFCVNLDLLASVGYTLPAQKDWTIAEFLKLAELIKQRAPGKYVTALFAKNQSSEEWWKIWFYAFGAKMFKSGDYTKTTLNTPAGLETLKFFKTLLDKGYVPADAAIIDDDVALDMFGRGNLAFLSMQVTHLAAIDSAVKQGIIAKPFSVAFIEMPHAPGIAHVPYTAGPGLAVVHKTDDSKRNALAARLAWYITSADFQLPNTIMTKGYPTRKSVGNPMKDNVLCSQVLDVKAVAGVADWGLTIQKFSEVRAQLFPLLAEMFLGKRAPEDVLPAYESTVNKILSGK